MPDEKIKILIAEDEGMLRDLLRIVFEKEGYSPVSPGPRFNWTVHWEHLK
jgi:hypothetical protein